MAVGVGEAPGAPAPRRLLSLILSKAMLLASDNRIEDPSILAQLAA